MGYGEEWNGYREVCSYDYVVVWLLVVIWVFH